MLTTIQTNPDYITILREMDSKETDILFEHTRCLRKKHSSKELTEERTDYEKSD
jgi:hypothetical protein